MAFRFCLSLLAAIAFLSGCSEGAGDPVQSGGGDYAALKELQRSVDAADGEVAPNPPAVNRPNPSLGSTLPDPQPLPALALARGHTFDVPENYPAAYSLWRRQTARLSLEGRPWVKSLRGTAGEVRSVRVDGSEYLYGQVCEPHNCGGNEVALLLTRDQGRVVGLVRLTNENGETNDLEVGTPTAPEARCLRFFLQAGFDATRCF